MLRKSLLPALLPLLLCSIVSTKAAPASFDDGVKAYNSRQYRQAISSFTQAASQSPADPMIRYYMGLSYQGLNQMTQAKQQFEYVSTCRANPALAGQAQAALQNLSRYKTTVAGSPPTRPAATSTARSGSPAASGQRANGRLKVIDFTTDWCHFCKKFEPVWEQVSAEMKGQVDFSQLDGDDPANSAIKEKYNVTGYPRLIFTDRTGNALLNHRGAPATAEAFKELINKYK